jgi:tetratricopeptide (TPR) repeat protein
MKADNLRKKNRFHDIAIEKAFQREKQGFFEGAALAFIEAANLLSEKKYPELIIGCLNNAANSYFQCETSLPAEKCLHRALNISEKYLEHENSFLALTFHHLGLFYKQHEDLDKAENYYCQALRIRKKILGDEHPDTSVTLNNLGGLYLRKNELDKAEKYYQQALKIREKTLGKNHPNVASILNNLSSIYQKRNDLSKAQEYNQLAKSSTENSLNSDDKVDAVVDINACILRQEIERLEREKLEMKAALHQADRLAYLGRMATMMAHNIKNPVNNITTATVSMLMGIKNKGLTSEQLIPSLERILNNSDRLNKIIENFRNFAQGDRTTFSNINLNETIEDIFQLLFVGQYQNHQIELIKAFAEFLRTNPTSFSSKRRLHRY